MAEDARYRPRELLQSITQKALPATRANKKKVQRIMDKKPIYVASCSFGKDSIATILLALENNEPLDRVVFSEVMFDHKRGISGEIPEHIEWIYSTAIPKIEAMGVKVDVVKSDRDYLYFFANTVGGGNTQAKFTVSR